MTPPPETDEHGIWADDDADQRAIDRAYLVIAALYACALIAGVAGLIELF